MKNKSLINLVFTLAFSSFLFYSCNSEKELHSVEDYYVQIPNLHYFNCEFENEWPRNKRKSQIIEKNTKNGYLFASDSFEFDLEMKLFYDSLNNRSIIGLFSRVCNIGGQCVPAYDFWTVEGGQWTNISNDVFNIDKITTSFNLENEVVGFRPAISGQYIKIVNCKTGDSIKNKLILKNGSFQINQ